MDGRTAALRFLILHVYYDTVIVYGNPTFKCRFMMIYSFSIGKGRWHLFLVHLLL